MKLLWVYLMSFFILPIIGEIILWRSNIHLSAGDSSLLLIIHNTIFVFIILSFVFIIQMYKPILIIKKRNFNYIFAKRVFIHSIIVLTILLIIIFILGGYNIFYGILDRGAIRTSLGILGPLYTLALSYIPVAVIVYVSVVYIHSNKKQQKYLRKKLILIYSFAILLGILSGYKAVAVTLMIPGFVVIYFKGFSIKKLILFFIITIIILVLFTAFVRHIGTSSAFDFFIYRITTMTAYGTIGVWNCFPESASFSDIFINFLGIFGEKISSLLLNISPHEPEFLKTNLSRLITYMVYPDTERALKGSVNITVTNFGHALYICGRQLYYFYAMIMGIIIGLLVRRLKSYISKGYPFHAALTSLYFFSVVIPSINSGGIFMLISFPILVYFILSYLILRYIIQGRIYVS